MSEGRTWTTSQSAAMTTTGVSLLVSAAAGSGKTSVLAERCVYLVCDAPDPCDVGDLLVVTFTEAAAAEMKDRISRSLEKRAGERPTPRLDKQIATIERAAIGTLHGFCSKLLRRHFHLLGIDPNFRILGGDEAKLLKRETVRQLFAGRYESEQATEFRRFVDAYGNGEDENLVEHVLRTYELLTSIVDQDRWMGDALARLEQAAKLPLDASDLGKAYIAGIKQEIEAAKARCRSVAASFDKQPVFKKYGDHLREVAAFLDGWLFTLDSGGVDELAKIVDEKLPKLPTIPSSTEGVEEAKKRVNRAKEPIKSAGWKSWLAFSAADWAASVRVTVPQAREFLAIVAEFRRRYAEAKIDDASLDFADLERLSLEVLRDENGGPSAVARAYHAQFEHVLVDEYQDINEVQDAILNLLSHECEAANGKTPNLFCVGDVKQSIYRFRLADPGRFLERRKQYSGGGHGRVIDLSENFRSRAPLLAVINGLFERVMRKDTADLDYDESQKLKPGLAYPPATDGAFDGRPIELHLLAGKAAADDEEIADGLDRGEREAVVIARRIHEIVGKDGGTPRKVVDIKDRRPVERPARYRDIVVLMRAVFHKADPVVETLRRMGVPVHADSSTGYFEATEIHDVLCALKLLDNGRQDVPLAAVLRSPLVKLPGGADSLARIRLAFAGETAPVPFHEAVRRYAEEVHDDLGIVLKAFRDQLKRWRQVSRQRPVADVVRMILDETGYLTYVAGLPAGEQRVANLHELIDRARQFGTFHRQGLGRFLTFLEKLRVEADEGMASIASDADDVVRVMSIHKSKGLEFPIVVVADLGKGFNRRDESGEIIVDKTIGLGIETVDELKRIRYPSLSSVVVKQTTRRQSIAEEIRVLYVAMTRAREHLILVGTTDESTPAEWAEFWKGHKGPLPAATVLAAKSAVDWVGPVAAVGGSTAFAITQHTVAEIETAAAEMAGRRGWEVDPDLAELKPLDPPPAVPEDVRVALDRVGRPYPFEQTTRMSAARSVSTMAKQAMSFDRHHAPAATVMDLPVPACLGAPIKVSAAEKGTATHTALEHLKLSEATTTEGGRAQVDKLAAEKRLTAEQQKAVDVDALVWLANSDLGRRIIGAGGNIRREVPVYFRSTGVDSGDPMDGAMVRGRIDLMIPAAGGWELIDYKTDRVRGAALDERTAGYGEQLRLYAEALTRMGVPVAAMTLVFLDARAIVGVGLKREEV